MYKCVIFVAQNVTFMTATPQDILSPSEFAFKPAVFDEDKDYQVTCLDDSGNILFISDELLAIKKHKGRGQIVEFLYDEQEFRAFYIASFEAESLKFIIDER